MYEGDDSKYALFYKCPHCIGCSETIYPNEVLLLEENPNYAHLKFRGIDGL
jgi:hypothetical protein